ncbi:MAG: tetratricopeptide repeat protein [Chitinophagaceae bacterium]|jgi:tetratricopeptide (TPR) repeat protein|nr:tetratricopeptide repeat protein [Chitinophagaceae bacterium]
MNARTEELYLEAEADIRNSQFHEAFRKYEEILYEEPDYAPAHNSLGWIYKTQFENYQKAEVHFKAAIASDPLYPHPYFHMASILIDLERFEELAEFLDRCLGIRTIDKSWVYYRYGMVAELRGQLSEAIQWYRRALMQTMSNEKVKDYQADMERCHTKMSLGQQRKPWLNLFRKSR